MALDTENERRAAAGLPPVPDGTIDAKDRRQITGLYPFGTSPVSEAQYPRLVMASPITQKLVFNVGWVD